MGRYVSLLLCIVIFSSSALKAQENGEKTEEKTGAAYQKDQLQFNAGITVSLFDYDYGIYNGYSISFPPITVNVEYGFTDLISGGPFVGYYTRIYNNTITTRIGRNEKNYTDKFTATSFGIRGTCHLTDVINNIAPKAGIDSKKFDIYATLLLGYEVRRWKFGFDYQEYGFIARPDADNKVIFGPVFGLRYVVKDNLGVYFEGGRGTFGLATFGGSLRF